MNELQNIQKDIINIIEKQIPVHGLRNPEIGEQNNTNWKYPANGHFWTGSFWTGQLWLAYMLTGKSKFKNTAQMRNNYLEKILSIPQWQSHDLGFLFSLSAVADYKLTKNTIAYELALKGAEALIKFYNPVGKFILAWPPFDKKKHLFSGSKMIIDCMQNLSLLIWAWQETNIQAYLDVAIEHSITTQKYIIREDYSSYHTFDFDIQTMEPKQGLTHQGYKDESCWSRGQAWAIHGYAQIAGSTNNSEFLEIAKKLADYAISKIDDDWVPQWDYLLDKDIKPYKDSSAGAIMAAGMLLIAQNSTTDKQKYHEYGIKLIQALRKNCDITNEANSIGLLKNGCSNYNSGSVDNMLPYGDYYYFEAVLRALGHTDFFW